MFITLKKFLEILDLCYENGRKVTILIILGLVLSVDRNAQFRSIDTNYFNNILRK